MNRTMIIAILVAVVAGGLYFYSKGNNVGDVTGDVVKSATGAVEGASDAVTGAAESAVEGAADAVEGATDAVEGAVEATSDAVAGAADTAAAAMDGSLFSAEGYDAVKVSEMIDASGLDENQKSGFKTALIAAGDDPALLADILTKVKQALGM